MNTVINKYKVLVFLLASTFLSCGGSDPDPEPPITPPVVEPKADVITVNPTSLKQEMIGFGGALTWYSNWVTANNEVEKMADLMFNDLGTDIVRLKNWYYPDNYPDNKLVSNMSNTAGNDNARTQWDTTNKLYEFAKARNPNIRILLSSWGPPVSLKDNDNLREGTLKKDASGFMYDAFAEYWNDVLDYVPFDPDYISIQNEPTYVNANWTTCKWAAAETASLPGYAKAFDKVYDKIKGRDHVPVMLGPESQDVPTFVSFANVLKDNPNCGGYGFHPYNISAGTTAANITTSLQSVGSFNTKPIIMTEFSDNLDWYNTALFIHQSLVTANASGYIYWKLAWSTPASGEDAGMISVSSASASASYKATPYYYLIKHYAKYVDAGYHRVEATSDNALLQTSAFISPDGSKLTLVIINTGTETEEIELKVTGKTIKAVGVFQSKAGDYYKTIEGVAPGGKVSLPVRSITTVSLDI